MSNPPSDPDSHFLAIDDRETETTKTLILMEFADIGSLDQYAVRISFRRNLVSDDSLPMCLACYAYALSSARLIQAAEVLLRFWCGHTYREANTETLTMLTTRIFDQTQSNSVAALDHM